MKFKIAGSLLLISSIAVLRASLAYSQPVAQVQPGALNTSNVLAINGGTYVTGNISLNAGGAITSTSGNIGMSSGGLTISGNIGVSSGGSTTSGNIGLIPGTSITPGNISLSAGGSIRTDQTTTTRFLTDNVVAINNISNRTGALVGGSLLTPVTANSAPNVGPDMVAINQGTIVLTGNTMVGHNPRVQPVGNPVIATRAVADSTGRISLIGIRGR